MLSQEAKVFTDSALEEINAIVPMTDSQFDAIREKLNDRIEAFEAECASQVKELCISGIRGVAV